MRTAPRFVYIFTLAAHEPILADDISLAVTLNQRFTATHPARTRTTLMDTAETPITLSIGPIPPFTSYLSTGKSAMDDYSLFRTSRTRAVIHWHGWARMKTYQ